MSSNLEQFADANTKFKLEALNVKIYMAKKQGLDRLAQALEAERQTIVLRI
jgi:hypothetical protein